MIDLDDIAADLEAVKARAGMTSAKLAAALATFDTDMNLSFDRALDVIAELAAGIEEPPEALLSGPDFAGVAAGTVLDHEQLHAAFGIDPPVHGSIGAHNLRVVDQRTMAHHTRGGGASIVEDRSQAWFPIPETDHVEQSFQMQFAAPFDFGWQSKFGYGLEGYHSGRRFPGGGWCFEPDWVIRPVWNQYPYNPNDLSRGHQPLRFGVYIYSTGQDRRRLDGQVWEGDLDAEHGGGHKRLVLFDDLPRPVEGEWFTYRVLIDRGADGYAAVSVGIKTDDGLGHWTEEVVLPSPANRVQITNGYGGWEDREGPAHPTDVLFRDLVVADLSVRR